MYCTSRCLLSRSGSAVCICVCVYEARIGSQSDDAGLLNCRLLRHSQQSAACTRAPFKRREIHIRIRTNCVRYTSEYKRIFVFFTNEFRLCSDAYVSYTNTQIRLFRHSQESGARAAIERRLSSARAVLERRVRILFVYWCVCVIHKHTNIPKPTGERCSSAAQVLLERHSSTACEFVANALLRIRRALERWGAGVETHFQEIS